MQTRSISYLRGGYIWSFPTGETMNIANIQGDHKPSTEAPHFHFELVQYRSPKHFFFLDLILPFLAGS
jgi:hypothetical protein